MKSKFLTICAIFFSLILTTTTSCSSDDSDGGGGGGSAAMGTLKATVDGSSFESSEMATSLTVVDAGGNTTMFITATDLQGRNMTLQIIGYAGEGSYDIGGANTILVNATWVLVDVNNPLASQTFASPYDGDAVRGTITITADSGDNMQGTFEFTAKDNMGGSTIVNVTNGSFNINY
jgi:hypothetical protein